MTPIRSRIAVSSVRQLQAQDLDLAGSRLIQALEDLDGRRLARAVGAEQTKALAVLDLQVDPVDGMDRAVSARVLLAQVLDANRPFPMPQCLQAVDRRLAADDSVRVAGIDCLDHGPVRQDADLGITTTPSRITCVACSSDSTVPRSLMTLTLRPMRAFLSMIARSMTELAPTPTCGRPSRWFSASCCACSRTVDPHDVGIADRDVLGDSSPHADDRILDHRAAADDACRRRSGCSSRSRRRSASTARKRGRVKIGPASEAKSNGGFSRGQIDIGLVERPDGPDVLPVAVEQVGLHPVAGDRLRQQLVAEVGGVARFQAGRPRASRLNR